MKFAPLHIYSGYSFLKSGLTIEKIVQNVKVFDYFGAAITDEGVMYGLPQFIHSMESIKKKCIPGMEIEVLDNKLCLYVINEEGYLNLTKISSSIQKGTFDFSSASYKGLIGVLDTHDGTIYQAFKENKIDETFARLIANISHLSEKFYLGIEISSKEDREIAKTIRSFATNYSYDLVAFPKIKYAKQDDAIVLKIVTAISNDETLEEKTLDGNEHFFTENNYYKIYTEGEINNTVNIINSSTFNFHKKRGELFHYSKDDSASLLKEMVYASLKEKGIDNEEYLKRAEYELDIIISMGYANYFLVVQDYVRYAKEHDILVGPGRGSAAGSLVSYALNITEIDPIKYGLQFERFLNPSRKSMPDIDVDFMDTRRDEVVEYCRNKYGRDKVANIITYQTILAKQALRDIGRIYKISNNHIEKFTKILGNKTYTLREAYKTLPNFKALVDSDKYFLEIVTLASKIEGLPRQSGVHASGVLLNNDSIENSMPVALDLSDNYISQYEMHYLEEQGFLKMDFLVLRNLTIISRCVDLINSNPNNTKVDVKHIPFDDPKTYEIISSCKTMGIFQLESSGMKRAIREIKPNCFEDIVAVLALFRPGPMQSIPTYARRKEGLEKVTYLSADLEKILSSTYGIIVYQEQISSIAIAMAGFSPSEADSFREAVSKKKVELLASLEKSFIDGAIKKGYSYKQAKNTYDLINKFANYGFNRCHSVGYALIACQMAYLKAYYPLEFYVAILENSSATSDTKFNEYVSEMKSQNIKMLPPHINKSKQAFTISKDGILFPLNSIKGVNDLFTNKIIYERNENGDFKDFFDFVIRMTPYKITNNQISTLINAGCFDKIHPSRASLRSSILMAEQYAKLCYDETQEGMLLDLGIDKPLLLEEIDDPLENLDKEYEVLGIMLSNNPLHFKKDLLRANDVTPIVDAIESNSFRVAGIVKTKKTITTKKGTPMAFIKIFDETGEMEIIIFPDLYMANVMTTEKNNILVISGKVERKNDEITYLADEISLLEE